MRRYKGRMKVVAFKLALGAIATPAKYSHSQDPKEEYENALRAAVREGYLSVPILSARDSTNPNYGEGAGIYLMEERVKVWEDLIARDRGMIYELAVQQEDTVIVCFDPNFNYKKGTMFAFKIPEEILDADTVNPLRAMGVNVSAMSNPIIMTGGSGGDGVVAVVKLEDCWVKE